MAGSRPGRPLTGAWIETVDDRRQVAPSRGRRCHCGRGRPLTGAWIETSAITSAGHRAPRRPLTGAWIETPPAHLGQFPTQRVAPSRGRGLKQLVNASSEGRPHVSPPHGGVD